MSWLRVALPWAVGGAILWVLFRRVDPTATLAALEAGDLLTYLPIACAFVGIWLAIDSYILAGLFSRIAGRIGWVQMMGLRAATYPAMTVSFHLASAALVASITRVTRAPVPRVAGGMLLHYLADLTALSGVALLASLAVSSETVSYLRPFLAAIVGGGAATLVAGRMGTRFLRGRPVVEALATLSSPWLAWLVLSRACFHLSFALFVWLTAPSWEIGMPLLDLLARMPLVLSIAALPISPAGLGTAQAAMLWLFAGFGSEAQILAYSLVYGLTLIALRLPLGVVIWILSRRRSRPAAMGTMA